MESSLIALTADYISITDMSLGGVLGLCCAGVWVTRAPRTCTIRLIHAPQGPRRSMGISDRHILVPYLWIRPISSWVRFGVKNQKKVDNAVVFGLRGMHNHTHLGHVMGYVVIGDIFRWFGAFFGVRGPPEGGPRTYCKKPATGVTRFASQ